MRTTIRTLGLTILLSWNAIPAGAAALHPGSHIRWQAAQGPGIGTAVEVAADTLVAMNDGDSSISRISVSSLEALEVFKEKQNHAGSGAFIGGLVGGLTLLGVAWAVDQGTTAEANAWGAVTTEDPHGDYAVAGALGVTVGAILGGIVGATQHQPERWEPVKIPSARIGLQRGEPALCVTVSF
jgi:hypothetical protein